MTGLSSSSHWLLTTLPPDTVTVLVMDRTEFNSGLSTVTAKTMESKPAIQSQNLNIHTYDIAHEFWTWEYLNPDFKGKNAFNEKYI